MISSTLQEVKRGVQPLDFSNRDHRALLFDLAWTNKEHLLNDHDNDIVAIIGYYHQQSEIGKCHAFLALVDDKPAGCFWLEIDAYDIGRIRGALLPEFRNYWSGHYFLAWILAFGFEEIGARKIEVEIALYTRKDRESAAAERLLKRIGFKKRAVLPESLMVNGMPKDTVLLDYLKKDYDVQKKQQE